VWQTLLRQLAKKGDKIKDGKNSRFEKSNFPLQDSRKPSIHSTSQDLSPYFWGYA